MLVAVGIQLAAYALHHHDRCDPEKRGQNQRRHGVRVQRRKRRAALAARDAAAKEEDARVRKESLGKLHNLIGRVEPLAARPDLTLKAAERALKDVKNAFGAMPPLPDAARFQVPPMVRPAPELVAQAAKLLSSAKNPVILAGRASRSMTGWNERIALAEKLDAPVLSSIKLAASFPTTHRLHPIPPFQGLPKSAAALIKSADVILALDWLDLAGTFKQAYGGEAIGAKVIHVSCDAHSHRGWSADYQGLPPADVYMLCETDAVVPLLLEACAKRKSSVALPAKPALPPVPDAVSLRTVAVALEEATRGVAVSYTRLPLGWNGGYTQFVDPLSYIGHDGGAGVGSGLGMMIGQYMGFGRLLVAMGISEHSKEVFASGDFREVPIDALA